MVAKARHLITEVLEDAYEFLSECILTDIELETLKCECMVAPDNYKFNPNGSSAMDEVSFNVDLVSQMIDPESIKVKEVLEDIQVEQIDRDMCNKIKERI